ncbi:MAG: ABC transporter ATP-binding protein [Gemmataceae bacterium]
MAEIGLERLTKRFANGITAVRDVTLTVADGEFVVLLGPSGCGKTTLLRLIAGLETPTSGNVKLNGTHVTYSPPAERNLAMVFQRPALYPFLTVYDNLSFGLRLKNQSGGWRNLFTLPWGQKRKERKADLAARVEKAVNLLGLRDVLPRRPRELSGGQQQRVALGRAIVRAPSAYLLDEPLSSLDFPQRLELRQELHLLQRQLRATILYVTHDQTEAMALADRVIVINEGCIQQAGLPLEVYRHPINRFVAGFIGSPAMSFLTGNLVEKETGELCLTQDGSGLGLPGAIGGPLKNLAGKAVTLGIRPEDIQVGAGEPGTKALADYARLAMQVALIQRLGNGSLVKLRQGSWELAALQDAQAEWIEGQPAEVFLNARRFHWFDCASGKRLSLASAS